MKNDNDDDSSHVALCLLLLIRGEVGIKIAEKYCE